MNLHHPGTPNTRHLGHPRHLRHLRHLGASLLWLAALLAPAQAQTHPGGGPGAATAAADCPPVPAMPGPEALREGLRQARNVGLLWRLHRDGRTAWLYGTLHLGRLAWAFPGPALTAALMSVDTVALEIDPTDPALAQANGGAMARLGLSADGQPMALPAPLAERLAALRRSECVEQIAGQPALLQALTLTMLAARRDGLDPSFAQEFVLAGFARATGKRLASLETPGDQVRALQVADAAELARVLQQMTDQLASGQSRQLMVKLAEAWAAGDLATLGDYERWCDCVHSEADRLQMRRLNDGRNPGLAERFEALVAEGRSVLLAVGALHMTGPQALPQLLRGRGWTVTPVVPATAR